MKKKNGKSANLSLYLALNHLVYLTLPTHVIFCKLLILILSSHLPKGNQCGQLLPCSRAPGGQEDILVVQKLLQKVASFYRIAEKMFLRFKDAEVNV